MFSATLALAIALSITASQALPSLEARQDCGNTYSKCSPSGATSTATPNVGDGMSSLYVDLLNSISGVKRRREAVAFLDVTRRASSGASLCCADGTTCLLLQNFNAPFCYDKFTTNFFLPDGSYGTIVTGSYTSPDGSTANLLSGNYTLANGTPGNIYGSPDSPSKPNTATLNLPTQFTSAGVGSAIPATALGAQITYTTTIPATTIEPTTVPAQTFSQVVVGGTTILTTTTAAATTDPGTVVPEITVQPTTVPVQTVSALTIGGSAIPTTLTEAATTVPGTTISKTTVPPTTIPVQTVSALTVGGSTFPSTITVAATTLPGTTVPATTLTVTTRVAAAATSTSAAGAATVMNTTSAVGLMGFLLMLLYGL